MGNPLDDVQSAAKFSGCRSGKKYCPGDSATIHEKGSQIIFEFTSETENYEWEEGEGWLSSLITLRADILHGDYRSLYLAWLFCTQMEEMEDDELEPPVPPNLTALNAPLKTFIDFMRIDTDLVAVAAEESDSESPQTDSKALKNWIHNLPASEKDDILFRLVEAPSLHLGAEILRRFQQTGTNNANSKIDKPLRKLVDLISRAETYAEERKRRAAEKKAREQARRNKEKAKVREKYLKNLVGQEDRIWFKIDKLIDSKQPKKYNEAVELLIDLRDLYKKTRKEQAFNKRLKTICGNHYRKLTFLDRLKKAGLRV